MRRPSRPRLIGVLCLAALGSLASCSDDAPAARAFEPARSATIEIDDPLPVAADPVLRIVDADDEEVAALDVDGIEALGTVRSTVYDRWLDRELPVEGVWVRDLLSAAGAPDATTVRFHALDDYEIEIPIADFDDHHVLLATRADGDRIAVEDGGPTRLVFLDPQGGDAQGNYWIWNIDEITLP